MSSKQWPDGMMTVEWDLQGRNYDFRFLNRGHLIHHMNTNSYAGHSGQIWPQEIHLHTKGHDRYFGISNFGRNNDIYYVAHFKSTGDDTWAFDTQYAERLGPYGCGEAGMGSEMRWENGIAYVQFWVGKNPYYDPSLRCELEVKLVDGAFVSKPT
jgi:hypothetical protein